MNRSCLVALLLGAVLLGGCDSQPAAKKKRDPNDPHAKVQKEMEDSLLASGKIIIVRLQSGGKRVEVTSILAAEIAEVKVKGEVAKTIFRVNDAGDGLVLFSRDLAKNSSFRTELKFADMERTKGFVFPVVQSDGSLAERSYKLEQIVIPQ